MATNATFPTIATTDGTCVYTSTGQVIPMALPHSHAVDLAQSCLRRGISQLWLCRYPVQLQFPTEPGAWDFQFSRGSAPESWAHGFKRGSDSVDLVQAGLDRESPWGTAPDAKTLLEALQLYRALVGITYQSTGAGTGARLLKQLHSGPHGLPLDLIGEMPPPALDGGTEAPLVWTRALTDAERAYRYLHSYDKNGAYLGACSSLLVGVGAWEHVTSYADAAGTVGYFLVAQHHEHSAIVSGRIPAFTSSGRATRGKKGGDAVWVTTPTLRFLLERWERVEVLEAYVWRKHNRPLEPWYETLRDARSSLMALSSPHAALALRAVKATYAGLAGGYLASTRWDRSDDPLYRPDIRHQIIAMARSNLLRNVEKCVSAGTTPVAIRGVDTIYFASDEPDPVKACPSGLKLGTTLRDYKVKDAALPLVEALGRIQ